MATCEKRMQLSPYSAYIWQAPLQAACPRHCSGNTQQPVPHWPLRTCRHGSACQPKAGIAGIHCQLTCSSTLMSPINRQKCLAPACRYYACGRCLPRKWWRWRPAGLNQLHGISLAVCKASQPSACQQQQPQQPVAARCLHQPCWRASQSLAAMPAAAGDHPVLASSEKSKRVWAPEKHAQLAPCWVQADQACCTLAAAALRPRQLHPVDQEQRLQSALQLLLVVCCWEEQAPCACESLHGVHWPLWA